jgi:hypothetical protein
MEDGDDQRFLLSPEKFSAALIRNSLISHQNVAEKREFPAGTFEFASFPA